MKTEISPESYGEFKGNTSAKLDILFKMMTDMQSGISTVKNDVQSLKDTRTWSMGWLSGVGVIAGIAGAFIKEKFLKSL